MLQSLSIETTAGLLQVAYRDGKVCFSRLDLTPTEFTAACAAHTGEAPEPAIDPELRALLAERLAQDVSVPFDFSGCTAFQKDVLEAVASIPRGQVRTYAEVAGSVGRPRAARAVGEVMRTNPIPVLIPCHRVVRTGGQLGNYSPRPEIKRMFLIEEGAIGV